MLAWHHQDAYLCLAFMKTQFIVCLGAKTIMFGELKQSFGTDAVACHRDVVKRMLSWLTKHIFLTLLLNSHFYAFPALQPVSPMPSCGLKEAFCAGAFLVVLLEITSLVMSKMCCFFLLLTVSPNCSQVYFLSLFLSHFKFGLSLEPASLQLFYSN